MTAWTYDRGHPVKWVSEKGILVYADTKELSDDSRSCPRCDKLPTKEGYDACLGHIPGAIHACCGHGVEKPYTMMGKDNPEQVDKEVEDYLGKIKA